MYFSLFCIFHNKTKNMFAFNAWNKQKSSWFATKIYFTHRKSRAGETPGRLFEIIERQEERLRQGRRRGRRGVYTVKVILIDRSGSLNENHLEPEAAQSAQQADHQCVSRSAGTEAGSWAQRATEQSVGRETQPKTKKKQTDAEEPGVRDGGEKKRNGCARAGELFLTRQGRGSSGRQESVKMPRVVPDQRSKFENEEFFRKLSRECEVRLRGGGNTRAARARDAASSRMEFQKIDVLQKTERLLFQMFNKKKFVVKWTLMDF